MLLVILLILLGVQHGRAQTVTPAIVNSTGNTYAQSDITYEWSVGEMALVEFRKHQDHRRPEQPATFTG
jgi:membrane-bound inhibitor of C-type lysozyme